MEQKYEQGRENAYRLRDIFGKSNFFLEIQDQGLDIEQRVNPELVRLSKETGIPLVATNDCRSEEHTSELQSPDHLVCRLLLEKKKSKRNDFQANIDCSS